MQTHKHVEIGSGEWRERTGALCAQRGKTMHGLLLQQLTVLRDDSATDSEGLSP